MVLNSDNLIRPSLLSRFENHLLIKEIKHIIQMPLILFFLLLKSLNSSLLKLGNFKMPILLLIRSSKLLLAELTSLAWFLTEIVVVRVSPSFVKGLITVGAFHKGEGRALVVVALLSSHYFLTDGALDFGVEANFEMLLDPTPTLWKDCEIRSLVLLIEGASEDDSSARKQMLVEVRA